MPVPAMVSRQFQGIQFSGRAARSAAKRFLACGRQTPPGSFMKKGNAEAQRRREEGLMSETPATLPRVRDGLGGFLWCRRLACTAAGAAWVRERAAETGAPQGNRTPPKRSRTRTMPLTPARQIPGGLYNSPRSRPRTLRHSPLPSCTMCRQWPASGPSGLRHAACTVSSAGNGA